jgi:hypothetical protein
MYCTVTAFFEDQLVKESGWLEQRAQINPLPKNYEIRGIFVLSGLEL